MCVLPGLYPVRYHSGSLKCTRTHSHRVCVQCLGICWWSVIRDITTLAAQKEQTLRRRDSRVHAKDPYFEPVVRRFWTSFDLIKQVAECCNTQTPQLDFISLIANRVHWTRIYNLRTNTNYHNILFFSRNKTNVQYLFDIMTLLTQTGMWSWHHAVLNYVQLTWFCLCSVFSFVIMFSFISWFWKMSAC